MASDQQDDLVWFFAYSTFMDERVFAKQIGLPGFTENATVVAENAWLSFDYLGLPFVEPAYPSLIVQGVNDGPFKGKSTDDYPSVAYLRYLHDRCFPGIPYEEPGELPPHVEGSAYLITTAQLLSLAAISGFTFATVTCQRFKEGDVSQRIGEKFTARALVAKDRYRSSQLMPTVKQFHPVYRGALVHCLSTTYLRYLVLLRPYNVEHGGSRAVLARKLFKLFILYPQFLLLYLPIVTVQKLILGRFLLRQTEELKLSAGDLIRWTSILAEKWLFRPLFGNVAYAIAQD